MQSEVPSEYSSRVIFFLNVLLKVASNEESPSSCTAYKHQRELISRVILTVNTLQSFTGNKNEIRTF